MTASKLHPRAATPDDAPALADLFAASYPPLMASAYAPEVLAAALPVMTKPNPVLLASGRFALIETEQGLERDPNKWKPVIGQRSRVDKDLERRSDAIGSKGALAVACGGYSLERPGGGAVEPGLAHIRHFATRPDFTGRGLGRAVFDWSAAGARALGCDRFECYAALNAVPFYRSLGFTPVREHIVTLMGVPFPSLVMTAPIV